MKSIRRFTYATVLFLSALNFAPSLASAQDPSGTFTLSHDVRWQKAIVPAGTYRFTMAERGASELLTLNKMTGKSAGFLMLVSDTEASQPTDTSRIVLVSRPEGSFVSAMELPEYGVTLHFAVPASTPEVARAAPVATTTAVASR
jgi:hypothetical protein